MLLNGPKKILSMKKCWSQNAHCEIESFTELVNKHFIKFGKKIDGHF